MGKCIKCGEDVRDGRLDQYPPLPNTGRWLVKETVEAAEEDRQDMNSAGATYFDIFTEGEESESEQEDNVDDKQEVVGCAPEAAAQAPAAEGSEEEPAASTQNAATSSSGGLRPRFQGETLQPFTDPASGEQWFWHEATETALFPQNDGWEKYTEPDGGRIWWCKDDEYFFECVG